MEGEGNGVARAMESPAQEKYRRHFLGWQCRIRQLAMREDEGRPSTGMRPQILTSSGDKIAPAATLILLPIEHKESTAFFRFQIRQTHDPRQAMQKGLAFLQESYYQKPERFSERMLGVFSPDSPTAQRLLEEGECLLAFSQFSQSYRLACAVAEVARDDDDRNAVLWHNRLFNPALTDEMLVLGFAPDWSRSLADPPPK